MASRLSCHLRDAIGILCRHTEERLAGVPGLTGRSHSGSRMMHTNIDTAVVVLVAEDETLVRLLANDILNEAGYRVLEARDGQEALTILELHDDVRALLTDVSMPNVDGISLANIVRGRWPHIAIVVGS